MKITKYVSIPLTLLLTLSLTTFNVHAEKDENNYFRISITYPNESAQQYDSNNFSASDPLDLSSLKASKKNVKIKLLKVVSDGEEQDLSDYTLSYDYLNSSHHVDSLIAKSTTLSLPASFVKAAAYTSGNAKARIAVRENDESPLYEIDTNEILPVKENNYNKAVGDTLSFVYLKNGLYGSKKKGIQLTKKTTYVNGKSIAKRSFAWWTSEYKYINKQWRATSFILSLNYPFKYNETKTYSAYRFAVNRNKKGYITGMKLTNVLNYNGSTIYGEAWDETSLSHRDATTASLTKNWRIGDTFKYTYLLTTPKITKIKASTESLTFNWKKMNDCDGFEVRYANNKNFDDASTYKINNYTATSATLNALDSNTKYYVKIRSFGKVDHKTYYSSYSKTKSVTVK